ncbi:protein of unknown function (plasmid) [Caballeronia sp. S22]
MHRSGLLVQIAHAYSQEEVNTFNEHASSSSGLRSDPVEPDSGPKTGNFKEGTSKEKGKSDMSHVGSRERRTQP